MLTFKSFRTNVKMNSVKIMCLVLLISEIGKLTFNTFISQASLTFMWSKWGGGGVGGGGRAEMISKISDY